MTNPTPATGTAEEAGSLVTRFGAIRIDPERIITFRFGVFGFGSQTRFVLAEVPEREVPFKLLQSVDDAEVGFLVLPIDVGQGPISRNDLERACADLGIDLQALVALAIVTLRADSDAGPGTINLKAPVLIDSERRLGCQYVLADEGYDLKVPLAVAA